MMHKSCFTHPLRSPEVNHPCTTTRNVKRGRGLLMFSLLFTWFGLTACGMAVVWEYEHVDGGPTRVSDAWPSESLLVPANDKATLVFFAHPKCPCTRASIGELARVMTHCPQGLQAYVMFIKPTEFAHEADWEKSDLWRSAAQIPGVTVGCDFGGREAQSFHAETSGYTLLYDKHGQLLFRGGITSSRGHSGDNAGRCAIVDFVMQGRANTDQTKVYGCALGTPTEGNEPCYQP